jgi:hypothetical protein
MRQLLRLVVNGKELGASVPHSMCDATHSCVSYARVIPALRNHLPEIAVVTVSTCLLLASCAALSPYRSLAFSVISGTLASACETGQSRFTAFAISLELRLIDAGHRGLHRQRDPIDHETFALFGQAHAGLRADIATGQPRVGSENSIHLIRDRRRIRT